jgi:hypothetical protein
VINIMKMKIGGHNQMCNRLHKNYDPIPKEGFAWKVFDKIERNKFAAPMRWDTYENPRKGVWWRGSKNSKWGFCIFLTRSAAREYKKYCSAYTPIVKRIKYKGGLGKHYEQALELPIAICKWFKIID